MYCQPGEFPYQLQAEYQEYTPQGIPYHQGAQLPPAFHNGNISPYSPTTPPDRPSPSFRIEDILLQSKVGAVHSYGNQGYPVQHYGGYQNGQLTHGCIGDRDYQVANNTILQLPGYFRMKPNLRTASGRKCRKPRTVFSELQIMVLEREFNEHKYLSTPQRTKLADRLGLNQTQVKTWYQNRRMKWKKETNECDHKNKLKQNENDDIKISTNIEQLPERLQSEDKMTCM